MANECISYYDPGTNLPARATAAVTGMRFLKVSGDRDNTVGGVTQNAISVAPADAGGRICGVAQADAPVGGQVGVVRGNSRVVPVKAGGANIAAFAEVEVGAGGVAVTKNTGVAVGYVVTGATANGVAQVNLY